MLVNKSKLRKLKVGKIRDIIVGLIGLKSNGFNKRMKMEILEFELGKHALTKPYSEIKTP